MARSSHYVYHWTHHRNVRPIKADGIDIARSQGLRASVWVCGEKQIAWAFAHIAQHHGFDPNDMVCLRIDARKLDLKKTALSSVYYTTETIPSDAIVEILWGIGESWQEFK